MQTLFDSVYANPEADEPREALADALEAAGDPRGEFVRLQLAGSKRRLDRAERAREKALLKAHRNEWLAPLGEGLVAASVKWERGFPVAGRGSLKLGALKTMVGAPALTTLERLDLSEGSVMHDNDSLERLVFSPEVRGLRELVAPRGRFLPVFAASDPPFSRLERLVLRPVSVRQATDDPADDAADFERALANATGLPVLRHLAFGYAGKSDPELFRFLWTTPLGRGLTSLDILADPAAFLTWLPVLKAHDELALETLSVPRISLRKTESGWDRLEGKLGKNPPRWLVPSLRNLLKLLGPDAIRTVAISGFEPEG